MSGGVQQGSALGLDLFSLFLNNPELGLSREVARLMDETKLFRLVKHKLAVKSPQRISPPWVNGPQKANEVQCRVMCIGAINK